MKRRICGALVLALGACETTATEGPDTAAQAQVDSQSPDDSGAQGGVDVSAPQVTPEAGGEVELPAGLGTVSVPAGAVSAAIDISAVEVEVPLVDADRASAVIDLGPDGAVFEVPVTVCLPVDESALEGQDACLGFLDAGAEPPEWRCQDEQLTTPAPGFRCGKTPHFTNFAILLNGAQTASGVVAEGSSLVFDAKQRAFVDIPAGAVAPGTVITIKEVLKPIAEAQLSSVVLDIGPSGLSLKQPLNICFSQATKPSGDACLGYIDTAKLPPVWRCEDECLEQVSPSFFCGTTDHFTNFAILLGGAKDTGKGCDTDAWITGLGGVIVTGDGAASLSVPPEAVSEGVQIGVARTVGKELPAADLLSNVFTFSPAGQTFASPAEICLKAEPSGGKDACLAYLDEKATPPKWTCEDSCLKEKGGLLCGTTDHFTSFAILLGGAGGTKGDECGGGEGALISAKEGGSVAAADGLAQVIVPPGALKSDTAITIAPSAGKPDVASTSSIYDLGPSGLVFGTPVQVCMTPDEGTKPTCLATRVEEGTAVAGSAWKCVDPCLSKGSDKQLCGKTDHFSSYTLLADPTAACPGG